MNLEPDKKLGYYKDPSNGDLWHLSEGGWSWASVGGDWKAFVAIQPYWLMYGK